MNAKLIDSLVQIIESLSPEEQMILEEKLQAKKNNPTWQDQQKLKELQQKIFERRGGKPLEPSPEELIRQMREERTEQIMTASFPDLDQSNYQEEK